jgi:eukaryotic-like serine/threonine-protein kinase
MGGRFALLIGTGTFRDGSLPQLDSPQSDVRDLAALLRDPYVAGFEPVIELVDAGTQQVGREIAHILDRRHRDDLVLIYYAGHALSDDEGQLHLAMHDTELDLLSPTSISAAFVSAEMDRCKARRQLLILDCRFGNGLAHGTKGAPLTSTASSSGQNFLPPPDPQRLAAAFHAEGRNRVVFASGTDPGRNTTVPGFRRSQVPTDPNAPINSPFTHALIEGLRGAADIDGDGRITIDELYEYAYSQLARRPNQLLPARRGESSNGVPVAYAPKRASVPPSYARPSRPPSPGALISDRYLTQSVLEESGLGILFAARDERSGRQVSVRILRPPGSTDAATLERFLREAQVASSIEHPNVVRILELGFEGRSAFIAMEPLEGETLGALLRRKPRLELGEALEILLPAMAGVAAAHAQNVIHRDLSPDNIFVNRDANGAVSSVKVLGFGLSTVLDEASGAGANRGSIRSPHYLPPEQLLGTSKLDVRADVYAFGVLLYQVLTGSRPFTAENYAAVLFRIGAGSSESPSTVCPDVPPAIDAIVRKAMAKDRAQRYGDVDSLRYALQDAAGAHGWTATRDSVPPQRASAPPIPRDVKFETPAVFERRLSSGRAPRSRSWIIGVSLMLAAGGAAGWLLSSPFAHEPTRASSATMQPANELRPAPEPEPEPVPAPSFEVALPQALEPVAGSPAQATSPTDPPSNENAQPSASASAQSPTPEPAPASEPPPSAVGAKESASGHKAPMPASLAAFLADAGIPVDSITPREARRLLIRARSEKRMEARAEARRERDARRPYGEPAVGEAATLSIKPLPQAPPSDSAD